MTTSKRVCAVTWQVVGGVAGLFWLTVCLYAFGKLGNWW